MLEAIILESALIKRYPPWYNVDEKDDKSSQYVIITNELWPRVFLARVRDFEQAIKDGTLPYIVKKKFGPYTQSGLISEALKVIRKLFPFKDKKSIDPRHDAFYRALGKSPKGEDTLGHENYLKTINHLILFFEGRKKLLRKNLEKEMKVSASELRFEDAQKIKRLLYGMDHINDIALIKKEQNSNFAKNQYRIEAYDIAHMAGSNVVGAMVASVNGEVDKSQYRKFKISVQKNDDIAGLIEILSRRLNHPEWAYPDLIVVDGNEVHLKHAEGVLSARRITIPVVAVTKDDRHKAHRLVGNPDLIKKFNREIISINAEVHRFAIKYFRTKQRKSAIQTSLVT